MSAEPVTITLPTVEGQYLHDLVEEYLQVIGDAASTSDAAVDRLTPDIYPDDPDASAAFRTAMHDDLLGRRRHDAQVVLASLTALTRSDAHPAAARRAAEVVQLTDTELDAWLRTLSAMRLIMADRLGIVTEDTHDPDDLRFGVYDWLGYRLDQLVSAADDRDAANGR